jgi:hypothetical protein
MKTLLLLVLLMLITSFKQEFNSEKMVDTDLWTDATPIYLPVTSEWTNRAEVADINGDNRLDLLFANGGNYSEPGNLEQSRVFINQGPDLKFKEITNQLFGNEKFYARVIKVRDINKDGIADIMMGTTFQTQSQLYLGTGNGEFKNVTATQLPQENLSIGDLELGDVDDDGDLDMILTDWGPGINIENAGGLTRLWLNDGNGKFTDATEIQMPQVLIQFSWDLEFIDFDNDFDLDIAVSCKRCGTSRIFENNGKGEFKNVRAVPPYTNNYEFEVMDVNKDGFLDMVTVNDGEVVNRIFDSRREHIFINNKGKFFEDATEESWPASENIGEDDNNVTFLDFDSDGDPDFILSSLTGEDRLLINDGAGKFKLAQPVLKGAPTPHTLSLVLGDINGDKKLDVIMGQGEGEKEIEERIFLGDKINPDTAPPIISHSIFLRNDSINSITIKARIHDNKSPNMPQDWKSVELISGKKPKATPMTWYGENLWVATISNPDKNSFVKICATDYCGNKSCININVK